LDPTDLAFAGIARQAEAIRDGAVSSAELVELCLERIATHSTALDAVDAPDPERARREAREADAAMS
jgi:amidase